MDSRRSEQWYPNWVELPREITQSILRRVGMIDMLNTAQLVCTTWRSVCKDPSMWRSIDMNHGGDGLDLSMYPEAVKMSKTAVDRSCGGLTDVNIGEFGTDDLVCYIADRSPGLKRLRIEYCYDITDYGLTQAVRKLPLLEELALICCSNVTNETLEAVGQSCPLLRSLKFNNKVYGIGYEDPDMEYNEEVLAIAKNMPHLRHLEIIGNELMTNEGLQAILDGCSHLESLDLRMCSNISLDGNLGKRCTAQIKNLRYPNDPLTDSLFIRNIRSEDSDYDHYDDAWNDGDYDYDDPFLDYDDYCDYTRENDEFSVDYEDLFFDYGMF